jgi:virulence-associated protein VapD
MQIVSEAMSSMFGPEGGLVRHYSAAALAATKTASSAAAPFKTTLRRIPLLPMQSTAAPHLGYTLALTPHQQGLPHHRQVDVTTLATGQLSLSDSQGSASWVATVVSETIGKSVIPRLTDDVVRSPVAVLVSPTVASSPTSSSPSSSSVVASVVPIHFICRCNVSSASVANSANAVTQSLQKYYHSQDTAALKDIGKNLADDSFEEEDPVLFRKMTKARKAADEEEHARQRADKSEPAGAPPVKVTSFLKAIPALKREREESHSHNDDHSGRSPPLSSAGAAMPPPPPVAKVPEDLESKTGAILRMHLNKTMKFDELWKEVARSLDSFKTLRNMSKDVQTEWARVCKASIQRILQQHGCHVADGSVTIPAQLH